MPETTDEKPTDAIRPTLRTVAELSGYAITTVSRALADDPRIAKSTREKVTAIAAQVGYVPNRAAQRLRTGRTKVISLLLNPDHEFLGFTSEFLSGFTEGLAGSGYAINITPDHISDDRLEVVRTIRRNALADAVVFTRTECFDVRARYLLEHDFPFVTHGRTEFTVPHPYVDYDNTAFARMAVERLVAKGRQHICIVMPEDRFTFCQHLRFGAMQAVRELGVRITMPDAINLDSPPDDIAAYLRTLNQMDDAPDGHVCVGEAMALITTAALTDAGLTPGVEADVVAKRASPISNYFRPRIETVYEDLAETGRSMARVLLDRIAGAPMESLQALLKPDRPFSL